jgi:S-DNA-T family DNA segregation ATPase FtsK/SpoIIIE
MAARRQATSVPEDTGRHILREAEALMGGAVAIFIALALLSYSAATPRANLGGPLGHLLADTALRALGVAAYLLPVYLALVSVGLLRRTTNDLGGSRLGGAVLLVCGVAALAGLVVGGRPVAHGGGWLGGFFSTVLRNVVGVPGAYLLIGVTVVMALVLATGISAFDVVTRVGGWTIAGVRSGLVRVVARLRRRPATASEPIPLPLARSARAARVPVPLTEALDEPPRRRAQKGEQAEAGPDDGGAGRADAPPPIIREPERKPEPSKRVRRQELQEELFAEDAYRLPPPSLLDPPQKSAQPIDETALLTSSRILENKLADFGVAGKVVAVRPGPVITTFEFEPAPGVKVSRIVNLADDLTMALRAASVRILAPIPGKPVVGVEVSNPRRDTVYIREMLQSDAYRAAESKLTLAIGKDTTGNVYVHDLARMPHLLIAGATGTGKSVSMNAMIMSVLFKASPRDVRMIMIDPKMLELSVYEHIPHLLVPVVTNPKKASAALANMVKEMEERYRLLHDKGVRNIDSYNRLVAQAVAAESDEEEEAAAEADEAPADGAPEATGLVHRHLPRIVVIIDELADLMLTVGHEIEESITRLAQKARAAGIHLILATQRPSVDVITGLIKANFPARVSFQVTSGTNSRTILDCIGAERLLGEGDMLFLPPGTARVTRLHGAFVSDQDVHRVVDFIKRQEQPRYDMALLEGDDDEDVDGEDVEDFSDELYDLAVSQVTEHRQASISWLQRRLRVGYNRAARMIERMEREGVVSAPSGAKGREVIARRIDG